MVSKHQTSNRAEISNNRMCMYISKPVSPCTMSPKLPKTKCFLQHTLSLSLSLSLHNTQRPFLHTPPSHAAHRLFNRSTTIRMYFSSVTLGTCPTAALSRAVSRVTYSNGPFGFSAAALPYLLSNQSSSLIGGLVVGSRSELRRRSIHCAVGRDSKDSPAAASAGSMSRVQWKRVGLSTW